MSKIFKIPYIITTLGTIKVIAKNLEDAEGKVLKINPEDLICHSNEQFVEIDSEELKNYEN